MQEEIVCEECNKYHSFLHVRQEDYEKAILERARTVVLLRRKGLSFTRIGLKIKKSRQRAYQIYHQWKDYLFTENS